MKNYQIKAVKEQGEKAQFLNLPAMLYQKSCLMQDRKMEEAVLSGKHILVQGNFRFLPFLCVSLKEGKESVAGRIALTLYEDEDYGFAGFYESIEEEKVALLLLGACEREAKKAGKKGLKGPIDLSFFGRYRFALEEKAPYTGEPANKAYYPYLFEKAGFQICNRYVSHFYDALEPSYENAKAKKRLEYFQEKGYRFLHPTKENFERYLSEIYPLLMERYKDFQGFRNISRENFVSLYSSLQYIVDEEMVFLAYDKEELKGFFLCLPDYGNLLEKPLNLIRLLQILFRKRKPSCYILLYLAVKNGAEGLGLAFSQLATEVLKRKKAKSIAALIQKGKASEGYFQDKCVGSREYVLLAKEFS